MNGDNSNPSNAAAAAEQLAEGAIIGGRYEIKSLIGQGGMGSVYLVEQVFLHRPYAMKTLHASKMSEVAWRRFQKEAQATSSLNHPCLIKVTDFGMIDDKQPYFVMDYIQGHTLSHYLEKQGTFIVPTALSIFKQIADALSHAHEKGVVHRDLKPSNIMLTEKGKDDFSVCIVDFGIAKLTSALDQEKDGLTRTGEIFGTPFYMSPEQCMGIGVDQRADIYAIGCVMYQVLTGSTPFIGDTPLSVMMQHQSAVPVSLKEASLGRSFPESLERVIQKMLAKDPDDRYQNFGEVIKDLDTAKLGFKLQSGSSGIVGNKASLKLMFSIFGGISAFLGVAAMSFVIGRSTAPQKSDYNIGPIHITASQQQLISAKDRDTDGASTNNSEYFSSFTEPSKRTFQFGSGDNDTPGIMIFPNSVDCLTAQVLPDGRKKVFATGDVVINNFQPCELLVSDNVEDHPEMLSRFRPEEIFSLNLSSPMRNLFHDGVLVDVAKFQSLTSVKIESSSYITNRVLTYLDRLPNLVELRLSKTSCTGDAVAKMKRIRDFTALDLSSALKYNAEKVLPSLKNSTAMIDLNLRRALVRNDYSTDVATISNLKSLDISASNILDEDVAKLVNLKHLEELNIYDCGKLTAKVFESIEKMPALKVLTIGSTTNTSDFLAALEQFKVKKKGKLQFKEMS